MATLGFGLIVYRIVLGSEFSGSADGSPGCLNGESARGLCSAGRQATASPNYYLSWNHSACARASANVYDLRVGRAGARFTTASWPPTHGHHTARLKLQSFCVRATLAAAPAAFLPITTAESALPRPAPEILRYVALVAAGGMANLWVVDRQRVLTFLSAARVLRNVRSRGVGVILIAIISLAPRAAQACRHWIRRPCSACRSWKGQYAWHC